MDATLERPTKQPFAAVPFTSNCLPLPVFMNDEGTWFGMEKMFGRIPAMREAGVTEFAAGVLGRLEGVFDTMETIERYIKS